MNTNLTRPSCRLRALLLAFIVGLASTGYAPAQEKSGPLSAIAAIALKDGKDGSINGGFATTLGLTKNRAPLPIKRLTAETDGATSTFSISTADKKTIILTVRREQMSTYYLTDLSGTLKRAVVNDAGVKAGGMTNLPVVDAKPAFEVQKDWWINKHSR